MARSSSRTLRRLTLRLVLLAFAIAAGYGIWAKVKLDRALAAGGAGKRSIRYEVVAAGSCAVKTSLPFVLRASAKRLDALQNWLPDERDGLIERRLDWSPGAWDWVDDPPPALPPADLVKLKALAVLPPPLLIDALNDPDPRRREVAGQALVLETGQDLGYRYDLSPERRAEAVAAWRKWWDENKVRYGQEKLEKVFKTKGGTSTSP